LPQRSPTPGPEFELVQRALRSGLQRLFGAEPEPHVLIEPEIEGWYPDLVLVYPLRTARPLASLPSRKARRVLHEVYRARGTKLERLTSKSYHNRRELLDVLDELQAHGLISGCRAGTIRCPPKRDIFPGRRIISIEAKIRDWPQAVEQASRNRWFSSSSYVLLPCKSWTSRGISAAAAANVGAIAAEEEALRILHRPRLTP